MKYQVTVFKCVRTKAEAETLLASCAKRGWTGKSKRVASKAIDLVRLRKLQRLFINDEDRRHYLGVINDIAIQLRRGKPTAIIELSGPSEHRGLPCFRGEWMGFAEKVRETLVRGGLKVGKGQFIRREHKVYRPVPDGQEFDHTWTENTYRFTVPL